MPFRWIPSNIRYRLPLKTQVEWVDMPEITQHDIVTRYWPRTIEIRFIAQPKKVRDAVCQSLKIFMPAVGTGTVVNDTEGKRAKRQLAAIIDKNLRSEAWYILDTMERGNWVNANDAES